jgi:hypothetical protein
MAHIPKGTTAIADGPATARALVDAIVPSFETTGRKKVRTSP